MKADYAYQTHSNCIKTTISLAFLNYGSKAILDR